MAEHLLIAVSVTAMLLFITTGVATVLLVRGARRRCRSVRKRLRGVRASLQGPGSMRTPASVALSTVSAPGWWAAQSRRHRMWRAVCSAEHSIDVARRSDAALGDLPRLATRLRTAAGGVDAALRVSARSGSLREEDRADCHRIEAAAADIQSAALFSLRSASRADAEHFFSAVRIEVAALAAGVETAHR